ncbi:MAG TPA: copper transporter, partial [Acidimicrobiales bacterium]|nr:copper transporter [Acidimicrobiales bacterium]
MINLRYHIVSITAVFLALGIGVALGSTLIERATVDTLESRLDEQEERLDETDSENARLRAEIDQRDELDQRLAEAGPARLFAGHLTDVSVTLIGRRGTDPEALTELESAV